MIITCPSCDTRYLITPDQIGPEGRTVRCARCEHQWHQERLEEEPVVVVERTYEPPPIAPPQTAPPRGTGAPRPERSRKAIYASAAAIILAVAVLAFAFRNENVGELAWLRGVYATAGVEVDVPMLEVQARVETTREENGSVALSITGIVTNPAAVRQRVPELQVRLLDAAEQSLREETRPPPVAWLQPGEDVPFSTVVRDIPQGAASVQVIVPDTE